MMFAETRRAYWAGLAVFLAPLVVGAAIAAPQAAPGAQPVRPIGAVTEVHPNQLILHTDSGTNLTVHLPEGVAVMRVPPGAKNLQQAVKILVSDINAGDRILIVGTFSADQKSMVASQVIDMSKAALAQAHQAQRLEWQHRGIAGVVQSLNPAEKSLVLAVPNTPPTPANPTHLVTVKLDSTAKLLRYAPDSVKFDDAKPGTFDEVKVGDQVRALGTKSADGTSFSAETVVSGTFRNIPATVISVDAAQGTLMVKDLATGAPVLVRTDADSKLHQLPPLIAMLIARFNSGGAAAGGGRVLQAAGGEGSRPGMAYGNRGAAGAMGGAGVPGDFNEMLDRTPPLTLSELKPGEPLIVVSTEGAKPSEVTAIAVMSGVEPILEARPKGTREVNLGPWNMSMGGGGGEGASMGGVTGP
jgi:hypothetical protein